MMFTFTREISIGNLLTIAAYLVAATVFVTNTNAQLATIRATLDMHAAAINRVSANIYHHAIKSGDALASPPVFLLPSIER